MGRSRSPDSGIRRSRITLAPVVRAPWKRLRPPRLLDLHPCDESAVPRWPGHSQFWRESTQKRTGIQFAVPSLLFKSDVGPLMGRCIVVMAALETFQGLAAVSLPYLSRRRKRATTVLDCYHP